MTQLYPPHRVATISLPQGHATRPIVLSPCDPRLRSENRWPRTQGPTVAADDAAGRPCARGRSTHARARTANTLTASERLGGHCEWARGCRITSELRQIKASSCRARAIGGDRGRGARTYASPELRWTLRARRRLGGRSAATPGPPRCSSADIDVCMRGHLPSRRALGKARASRRSGAKLGCRSLTLCDQLAHISNSSSRLSVSP